LLKNFAASQSVAKDESRAEKFGKMPAQEFFELAKLEREVDIFC